MYFHEWGIFFLIKFDDLLSYLSLRLKLHVKLMTIAGLCHQNKNLKKTAPIAVRFCWLLNNKITNVLNCSSIDSSKSFPIGNNVFEWHDFSVKEILIDVDF